MPSNAEELIARLRRFIWEIRHGRRGLTAATIATVLFGAGTWLRSL
jgi:hypothetical protein